MPDTATVFDLDALIHEATAEPFKFRFDGEDYECPADIDLRVVGLLADGDLLKALETMLGPDQWARLKASGKTFGVQSYVAVLNAYATHVGASLPNLVGSITSSGNTAPR